MLLCFIVTCFFLFSFLLQNDPHCINKVDITLLDIQCMNSHFEGKTLKLKYSCQAQIYVDVLRQWHSIGLGLLSPSYRRTEMRDPGFSGSLGYSLINVRHIWIPIRLMIMMSISHGYLIGLTYVFLITVKTGHSVAAMPLV